MALRERLEAVSRRHLRPILGGLLAEALGRS